MEIKSKNIEISNKEFTILELSPWKRLIFIADLQRDFINPMIKLTGEEQIKKILSGSDISSNFISIISNISSIVDGDIIEKWVERILNEKIIQYTSLDGVKKENLTINDLNEVLKSPMDIIQLIKETIFFNLEDVLELFKSIKPKSESTSLAEKFYQ